LLYLYNNVFSLKITINCHEVEFNGKDKEHDLIFSCVMHCQVDKNKNKLKGKRK
jgi:hypothetical protein